MDFGEILECPYVQFMEAAKNLKMRNLSLMDISDVMSLIRVLFKINIDIANREYYLKIDVEDGYGWWYGYEKDGKWISFEPTVEYKFSNFHASNQV